MYVNKAEEQLLLDVLEILDDCRELDSDQLITRNNFRNWLDKTRTYSIQRRANEVARVLEKRKDDPKYCQNYKRKSEV